MENSVNFKIEFRLCIAIFTASVLQILSTPALGLSWLDIKSMAQKTAPDIKQAETEREFADIQLEAAKSLFLPKIYSQFSASRAVRTEPKTASNEYSGSLSVEQSLFSSGRDIAKFSSAKFAQNASNLEVKLNSAALRAQLARAWNDCLYLNNLEKITRRTIARREGNHQIVKLRYKAGRESKGSVLKTEAATLESQVSSLEASAQARLARGELAVLMGQEVSMSEPLSGQLYDKKILDAELSTPRKQDMNLEVQATTAKLKAAEHALISAKRQYLPEVTLSGTARKSATPDLPLADPVYSASVAVRIPIYDASHSDEVRSAAVKASQAEIEASKARARVDQKIIVVKSSLEFTQKHLEATQKGLEASKLQAEVSRQRYTLGLLSFQDWDSYENERINYEMDVLKAQRAVAYALADFYEAHGVTLEEGP